MFRAPERGSLLAAATCCLFSLMPPAAIFLSTAKEIWKRTPPKTDGFWNSFQPIVTTPQKGPQGIASAPIPAAADMVDAVDQRTPARYAGAAAIREPQAIRCTTISATLIFAWYTITFPDAPSRAGSLETCGFKQRFWSLLGLRPKVTRARGRGTPSLLVIPLAADKIHIVPPVCPTRCPIGREPRHFTASRRE